MVTQAAARLSITGSHLKVATHLPLPRSRIAAYTARSFTGTVADSWLCQSSKHRRSLIQSSRSSLAVPTAQAMGSSGPASASGISHLLVLSSPDTPELSLLSELPNNVKVVATGQSLEQLSHLSDEQWASIDVLLNCGVGKNAVQRDKIEELWPKLSGLRWMHSSSAGLEHLLFPALVEGDVVLSNAKGVYSHSLAEWALAGCSWFAKDLPRLARQQKDSSWVPYDVEELRGKTLGIIGYGDIGQSTAALARAYKMRVIAMRRRTQLSAEEQQQGILDKLYSPDELPAMVAESDYVVAALPHTPATHELVGRAVIEAMRPNAVFINIGRGKVVDEPALVEALQQRRIRGAALDVFYTEPLPGDSPLWSLDNVLLSPHCADRTKEFQFESLKVFLANLQRYKAGQTVVNIVDKKSGY